MDRDRCSVARTLQFAGDRWTLLILREVSFYGVCRFERLHERLGISRAVLSERLERLVEEGIIERAPYRPQGERARSEYRLSPAGEDLFPLLVAFMRWGDRYRNDGRAPVIVRHRGCGEPVDVLLTCAAGHPVARDDVEPHLGPGAGAVRAERR